MRKKTYNVAVLGATGAVGETMLDVLASRHFPVGDLYPLGSERSAGSTVVFGNRDYPVGDAADFDWSKADIGLFSAGGSVSAHYAPKAAAAGCVVIDNTAHFRYEPDIPLVVPEVNAYAIADYHKRGIIANPNCSTIQMLLVLKPIHDAATIERVVVSTYQAVSGTGKAAIEELAAQTRALFSQQEVEVAVYPKRIAFNCLPQIDVFQDNGYTKEEMKMTWETQKIMADPSIQVTATCVRVPVFYGHSESINIVTQKKLSAAQVRELLLHAPGVQVMDERQPGGYPTAVEAANTDMTYVGRIREDVSHERGINLWVVADNVRKGAALNSVQIAEVLVRDYL